VRPRLGETASPRLKEYWIVDPQQRTIETYARVWRNPKLRMVLREQDELTTSLLPGFSCRVADIFRF
jgi:Uma2 family endonuclease